MENEEHDDLETLAQQAAEIEQDENAESEFIPRDQPNPEEEEAAQFQAAQMKAAIAIGTMVKLVGWRKEYVVIPDADQADGIKKLTPLMLKYGDGELPEWLAWIPEYQDEFKAGVWFAGVTWNVREQIKKHEAEEAAKAKKEQEEAEAADDE